MNADAQAADWFSRVPGQPPWVVAHRGGAGLASENSRAAFRQAAQLAATSPLLRAAELDIQATSDGVPVVFHDETLERLTTGRGRVEDWTWEGLTSTVRGPDGAHLPRLEEVLPLVAGSNLRLFVEVKNPRATRATLASLEAGGWRARCVIGSFREEVLRYLHGWEGLWLVPPEAVAHPGSLALPEGMHPQIIGLARHQATPPVVSAWHQQGLAVWVYTVNNQEEARHLAVAGVDALISDFPNRLLEGL